MSASDGSRVDDTGRRRRRLLLLVVALLVLFGAGIGGFILSPPASDDDPATPTPAPTDTASATPTDDGSPTPETPGGTATPTVPPTETPGDPPTGTPTDPGDAPTATATPTQSTGGNDDDDDSGGGGPTTPSPGLELGDDGSMLSAANLAPGDTGEGTLTIRNGAGEDGELTVSAIDVDDAENGIVGPEADVDTSPNQGELSKHLEVRVAFEDGAGDREYVLDTDGGYVPLSELQSKVPSAEYALANGEEVTLVTEWELPASTGNVVQSDGVSVDVGLTLQSSD